MALLGSAPASLCILRLSAIGDCCHAIALVQTIQRQWPLTKITWVTGKVEAQLLQLVPGIEVVVFDKNKGLGGYLTLWKALAGRRFDVLLHMQAALRASIASLGIKATYKLGFDRERAKDGQWLFTNKKVAATGEHVVEGFMGFAKALGITKLQPSWSITIPEADRQWANTYTHQQPLLLICPGASKAYKNWTAEGYAALADYAHNKGMVVMLIGSPAAPELTLAEHICQLTANIRENLVGHTTLSQLLALIAEARLVVAPDTGPSHMATLVNTPVLGLYAHHNPHRTGPYFCRDYVVSVYEEALLAETGKTANQLPWRTRVKDPTAMQRISIEQVIAQFNRITHDLNLFQESSE